MHPCDSMVVAEEFAEPHDETQSREVGQIRHLLNVDPILRPVEEGLENSQMQRTHDRNRPTLEENPSDVADNVAVELVSVSEDVDWSGVPHEANLANRQEFRYHLK